MIEMVALNFSNLLLHVPERAEVPKTRIEQLLFTLSVMPYWLYVSYFHPSSSKQIIFSATNQVHLLIFTHTNNFYIAFYSVMATILQSRTHAKPTYCRPQSTRYTMGHPISLAGMGKKPISLEARQAGTRNSVSELLFV